MAYKDEPSLYPKNCISGLDWEQVHKMIDDAMEKRDRTVSIYINPDGGMSVNCYPWPDADELYEQYQKGRITAYDFRLKMGLPPMRDPEQFMKRSMLDQELWESHAYWEYWGDWDKKHVKRIDNATCSKCGYKHPAVYGSNAPDQLCKVCPGCGRRMGRKIFEIL